MGGRCTFLPLGKKGSDFHLSMEKVIRRMRRSCWEGQGKNGACGAQGQTSKQKRREGRRGGTIALHLHKGERSDFLGKSREKKITGWEKGSQFYSLF